jgi:hypothetical protein
MLRPSVHHLQLLFDENPEVEYMLVTDCQEPLYQADLKRIESERKFKTHIKGAFFVQRSLLPTLCAASPKGLSWTDVLGPFEDG